MNFCWCEKFPWQGGEKQLFYALSSPTARFLCPRYENTHKTTYIVLLIRNLEYERTFLHNRSYQIRRTIPFPNGSFLIQSFQFNFTIAGRGNPGRYVSLPFPRLFSTAIVVIVQKQPLGLI